MKNKKTIKIIIGAAVVLVLVIIIIFGFKSENSKVPKNSDEFNNNQTQMQGGQDQDMGGQPQVEPQDNFQNAPQDGQGSQPNAPQD